MALPAFHKYIAELLGTFLLVLAVTFAIEFPLGAPAAVVGSVTLMLLVYTIGTVSGAHVNPAVTLGMLSIQKIALPEAVRYILAQLLGATLAIGVRHFIAGAPTAAFAEEIHFPEYFAEFLGAMILTFGVATVALGKVDKTVSGIVVGGSLFVGLMLATPFSLAILNPAVAMGLQVVTMPYVISPILGGIAGAHLRRYLN